jgi:hypothetical protein
MNCTICGDETDNQEEICDNCKASIISEDLMEAVELSRRLGELGFPNLPDDQMLEIERELKSRGMMF